MPVVVQQKTEINVKKEENPLKVKTKDLEGILSSHLAEDTLANAEHRLSNIVSIIGTSCEFLLKKNVLSKEDQAYAIQSMDTAMEFSRLLRIMHDFTGSKSSAVFLNPQAIAKKMNLMCYKIRNAKQALKKLPQHKHIQTMIENSDALEMEIHTHFLEGTETTVPLSRLTEHEFEEVRYDSEVREEIPLYVLSHAKEIINNGIKYGDSSPIDVKISKGRKYLTIIVANNGGGIDKKTLGIGRKKEIFKRGVSSGNSDLGKGCGDGLAFAKRDVEKNGGKLNVHEQPHITEKNKKRTFFEMKVPLYGRLNYSLAIFANKNYELIHDYLKVFRDSFEEAITQKRKRCTEYEMRQLSKLQVGDHNQQELLGYNAEFYEKPNGVFVRKMPRDRLSKLEQEIKKEGIQFQTKFILRTFDEYATLLEGLVTKLGALRGGKTESETTLKVLREEIAKEYDTITAIEYSERIVDGENKVEIIVFGDRKASANNVCQGKTYINPNNRIILSGQRNL